MEKAGAVIQPVVTMGALRHFVEIAADIYKPRMESEQVRGIPCPRCNGRGGFIEQTGRDEFMETPCGMCEGAGRLKATVTIEWSPDNEG